MSKKGTRPGQGGQGDEQLDGTPRNDLLIGKKGNDILAGHGGNDLLIGGHGFDTALYSGSFLDYSILRHGEIAIVRDLRGGSPDGLDLLVDVEKLQFADFTLYLDGRNNAPYARDDVGATSEDESVTLSRAYLTSNDREVDGDALSVTGVALVDGLGGVALVDGNVVYDPGEAYQYLAAGESAAVILEYTVADGRGGVDTARITVTVSGADDAPQNHAPVAAGDSYTVDEDAVLLMFGSGVLGNDTDADADTLSAILVSGPAHGTLTLNADGGFTYTPGQNFNGEDSFSYRASDGVADSNQATVTITVAALNDAPVTADDSNAASDDGVAATGNLLANDGDVDGDTLAVGIGPYSLTYGQLELDADGNYSYLVTDQSLGVGDERTDSFTYAAFDGTTTTPGQITFHVSGANDAPTANADSLHGDPFSGHGPVTRSAADLLANDSDPDQGTVLELAEGQVVSALGATVTFTATGYTYDASAVAALDDLPAGLVLFDSFEYSASDQDGGTASAQVELSVRGRQLPPNEPPFAMGEGILTNTTLLQFPAELLARNDVDPNHDALTVTDVGFALNGSVSLAGGMVTFIGEPSTGFGAGPGFFFESESNNTRDTAQAINRIQFGPDGGADPTLGKVIGSGSFSSPSDVDYYAFQLRAGEVLTVNLGVASARMQMTDNLGNAVGLAEFDGSLQFTAPADLGYGLRIDNGNGFYSLSASLAGVARFEFGSFNYTVSDGQAEATGFVAINAVQGSVLHGTQFFSGDTIVGGNGPDQIIGDFGSDVLIGGGGSDRFVYTLPGQGFDSVVDFQTGFGGDVIDLSLLDNGFDGNPANLSDFVQLANFGGLHPGSLVRFSAQGTLNQPGQGFYEDLMILEGRFDLDEFDLWSQGNLVL
ncbi:MAG TPA: Ig-like domain-containing protein [Burkholderiales bacterium]|nr:Ig-like domain-containing protein [Burkholderiales bacterium]